MQDTLILSWKVAGLLLGLLVFGMFAGSAISAAVTHRMRRRKNAALPERSKTDGCYPVGCQPLTSWLTFLSTAGPLPGFENIQIPG